jgi:hypothetical protein
VRRALAAAVALGALALPHAAAAQNACDVIKRGAPARKPGTPRPPLIVGDSTALLAVAPLIRLGAEADARGCRQVGPAVDILSARKAAGTLPRVAALVVGANGSVPRSELRRALGVLGPHRILGLVTTPVPYSSAQAMRVFHTRHPTRTVLIDWGGSGIPQSYGGDGLHIGYAGEARMARFIYRRLHPYTPPRHPIPFPPNPKSCGLVHPGGRVLEVVVLRGAKRVTCEIARRRALSHDPATIPGWNWFNWRFLGRPPYTDVFARHDGRIIVAARRPAPAQPRGSRRRAP